MSLVLQYLNPTRSYSQLCTPRYTMKNLQNVTILLAHHFETIQVGHLKIVVASFLLIYYVCTKLERNLRHASVFRVDLTRNDPEGRARVSNMPIYSALNVCESHTLGMLIMSVHLLGNTR